MKRSLILLLALVSLQASAQKTKEKPVKNFPVENTIYQFKVEDLSGNTYDLAQLKGKKVIIVNTASKCGLTPQYEDLEKMYRMFSKDGLVIVGFPANDFAGQEPGTNKEIGEFCKQNYGVTFPMMSKIAVTGDEMAPIYKFLTQKKLNGFADSEVQWNFQKFLISRDGRIEKVIGPKERLTGDMINKWMKS